VGIRNGNGHGGVVVVVVEKRALWLLILFIFFLLLMVSTGTSVDIMVAAVQSAEHVIGHINAHMPRTLGDGLVHISQFDTIFQKDVPLHEHRAEKPTEVESRIGR